MRKRYTNSKKFFAALLAFVMIFGMIPLTAMASDTQVDRTGVDGAPSFDYSGMALGEVRTGKTVVDVGGGAFDITLHAAARAFTHKQLRADPIEYDVVFVLDYSGSMGSTGAGNAPTAGSLLANMQAAALSAINQVAGGNDNYQNRVAVIKYNQNAQLLIDWTSSPITAAQLYSGLYDRTNIMSGMNMAYGLIADRTGDDALRPAVIILMTDGQPNGYYYDYQDYTQTGTTGMITGDTNGSVEASFYTIRNMQYMKSQMPGNITIAGQTVLDPNGNPVPRLEINTIGFNLNGITNDTNRAYAYAVMNPPTGTMLATDQMPPGNNTAGLITSTQNYRTGMNNVFNRLNATTYAATRTVQTQNGAYQLNQDRSGNGSGSN